MYTVLTGPQQAHTHINILHSRMRHQTQTKEPFPWTTWIVFW